MEKSIIGPSQNLPAEGVKAQQAEKIINIGTVDSFHQHTTQIYLANGLPGTPGYAVSSAAFSADYYNLVVWGQDPMLTDCHITLPKNRCLVEEENISPELKNRFSPLTPENREELRTFLCLLASENRHYGWTDEDHYASVAQLLEIRNRSNGIELYFHPLFAVPQSAVSCLIAELGICGKQGTFNELNHSHWSIKQINLMEVLTDHNLNPFSKL